MDYIKNLYNFIKYIVIKHEGDAENDFADFEDIWNQIKP